jgi:branched-chain amino acid aminotransferase
MSKVKNLLLNFLAYREARKADALDALLIDQTGNIREGTRTNFFAIKGNTIYTAPAEQVLEGVTKKIVFQVARPQFEIQEVNIAADQLANYDEFFITSTSMNVMPVSQIDDYIIKTDFTQTKKIMALFKEYYRKNVLE